MRLRMNAEPNGMSCGFSCEGRQKPTEKQVSEMIGDSSRHWDEINTCVVDAIDAKPA